MTAESVDEEIRAQLTEAREILKALEVSNLDLGGERQGRTEARVQELRRQIAMYQSILEKHQVRT
jgi:transcription elongation GreA/GreB family factor